LRQADGIIPKLAIIVLKDDPVIDKYTALKKQYGEDILVETEIYKIEQQNAPDLIKKLNEDPDTQAIIVQLPIKNPGKTDEIVNLIKPEKDVDGLGKNAKFDCATPMAVLWLLAAYNIELEAKSVVVIGQGRLVGAPLTKMLRASGIEPNIIDIDTKNRKEILKSAEVIISAVGHPGIITSDMIPKNCVVIDVATANEGTEIKGDLDDDVYEREDLKVTPKIGGVGPLTISALFDNVIKAF